MEAEARERRTATAARVCPRQAVPIPPNAVSALGCAVKAMEPEQSAVSECAKVSDGVAGQSVIEHRACVTPGSG